MPWRPLLLILLSALLLVACRPTPSDPIEYLHRDDSIIIQVLAVDADASEIDRALAVPEFTLYGDGTLIYQHETADGTRLLETTLPEDAVQELLEDIVDEGFLDFLYDQPTPASASGITTFVYVHTRQRANAVSIRGAAGPQEDTEKEYRSVQQIIGELRELDPISLGAEVPTLYLADRFQRYLLAVNGTPEPTARVLEPELVEPPRIRGSTLERLLGIRRGGDGITILTVSYAPLLPFYENFPEFNLR